MKRKKRSIRALDLACAASIAATMALAIWPVSSSLTRLLLVAAIPSSVLLTTVALWPRRWVLWIPAALAAVVSAVIFLPGRDVDRRSLEARYVGWLRRAEGVSYVWGGEGYLGMDCSGLVRHGLIMAHTVEGVATLNPEPVRTALSLWWRDGSARDLRDGDLGRTTRRFSADGVNHIRRRRLRPGDMAVTSNGVHVMVYVGDDEWMAADPDAGEVIRVRVPVEDNPWFDLPVFVVRWSALEGSRT